MVGAVVQASSSGTSHGNAACSATGGCGAVAEGTAGADGSHGGTALGLEVNSVSVLTYRSTSKYYIVLFPSTAVL